MNRKEFAIKLQGKYWGGYPYQSGLSIWSLIPCYLNELKKDEFGDLEDAGDLEDLYTLKPMMLDSLYFGESFATVLDLLERVIKEKFPEYIDEGQLNSYDWIKLFDKNKHSLTALLEYFNHHLQAFRSYVDVNLPTLPSYEE